MRKILVIEDDRDIADIVEMALEDKYIVKVQTNNREITAAFENFSPDLIMVDNYIGQRRSPEIVEEIRSMEAHKTTPVILFSGHPDIKEIAAQINAAAYLPKPFNLEDLYTCVEKVVNEVYP